ncbi:hypothetical protein [Isoptericola hypogeus]|uniref:hypothetical protein n=1 Tax=Isoptericola hypogeus TaxID=300179 RepID=UPI0031CE657C
MALEFVDRVRIEGTQHARDDCIATVLTSPVATTRLLEALLRKLALDGELWEPRWERTCDALSRCGWVIERARGARRRPS